MRNTLYFFIVIIFSSCITSNNNQFEDSIYEVLTVIINSEVKSIPPPPDFDSISNKTKSKQGLKLKVALDGIIKKSKALKETGNVLFNNKIKDVEFHESVQSVHINIEKILTKKNLQLFYADTVKINNQNSSIRKSYYNEFDVLVRFSSLKFDKNFTKALLIVSLSWSDLAGGSVYYYLEKNNAKWEIVSFENLEIS